MKPVSKDQPESILGMAEIGTKNIAQFAEQSSVGRRVAPPQTMPKLELAPLDGQPECSVRSLEQIDRSLDRLAELEQVDSSLTLEQLCEKLGLQDCLTTLWCSDMW